MLEFLKPVSGEHSVTRVIAVIHVPQIFLKPQNIFEKIKENTNLSTYQKKSMMRLKTFNITDTNIGISEDDSETGFVLEEFDTSGRLENMFKLENVGDKQSNILLENRIYEDWDKFLPRFIRDVDEISEVTQVFMEAISLAYVDEFIWSSKDEIDVNSIFNTNSELINRKFLNSSNGTLSLITQDVIDMGYIEEKVEISFSNRIKRITIGHQCALKLDKVEVYAKGSNEMLIERFHFAHERNKSMLKDVLTKEVLDLIKIK